MRFRDQRSPRRIRVLAFSAAVALLSLSANGGALASPSPVPGAARAVGPYRSQQARLAALSAQRMRTFRLPSALTPVTAVSAHQDVRISGMVHQDGRLARANYVDYCVRHPLQLESVSGDLTQGGTIVASGSCFGKTAGAVKMLGAFPTGAISLVVQSWTDQTVTATVPALTGVPDQPVKIELVARARARGQADASADAPMIFVSKRRVANVPTWESYENLSCAAGEHPVSTLGPFVYPIATVQPPDGCGRMIVGWGAAQLGAAHGQRAPDSGSDTWRVHMPPGWRFDHIDVSEQADVVINPTIDPTNVSWTANWHTVTTSWNEVIDVPGDAYRMIVRTAYDGSYVMAVYGSGPV